MGEKKYIVVDDGKEGNDKVIQALIEKFGEDSIKVITPAELEGLRSRGIHVEAKQTMPEDHITHIRTFDREIRALEEDLYTNVEGRSKEEMNATLVDIRREPKIGRNSLCPCNSGKKYKNCCINKKKENGK